MNDDANREQITPDPLSDDALPVDGPAASSAQENQPASPGGEEDIPEWLLRIRAKRELERGATADRSATVSSPVDPADDALPVDGALPDWVKALEFGDQSSAAPPESEPVMPPPTLPESVDPPAEVSSARTAEPTPPLGEQPLPDEAPDWVKHLPDTAESLLSDEGDSTADTPAWLQDVIAEQAAALQPAQAALLKEAEGRAAEVPTGDVSAAQSAESAASEQSPPAESVRERRARRRRERRTQARRTSSLGNTIQSLAVVGAAAVLIATIFTFWTPANFLSEETREGLRPAYATLSAQNPPTPVPTPAWMRRIGVVSGHWGPHPSTGRSDPGAVCPDGLTEAEVNRNVATVVVQELSGMGFDVDLLDEWDPRLDEYQASVLLSIHADSCHQFDLPGATGFKVAPPSGRTSARADDMRLHDCLVQHYGSITGMPLHPSLTRDMTEYHSFREIAPVTPASIIELGFMHENRDVLENSPELLAEGIIAGVMCFLENAPPTPLPEVTPWPTIDATPTPLETPGLS
ncbi:N-acetylmuramoyl-L-alanine amidase [Chloroflexota bacterium]